MPHGTARLVPLDGPSRPRRLHEGKDLPPASPLLLPPPSSLHTTASSNLRPSTRHLLACEAMHRPRDSSPTARPLCHKRHTSTTYPHNKQTTVCHPSQTCSQSPSEPLGTTTSPAARVTRRTRMCSPQCPRPASRPITSTPRPQRRGPANTSLPRKQLRRYLVVVRISCPAWSITAATNHPRLPHPCRTRQARQLTHLTLICTEAVAHGDVVVTSMNRTTAPPLLADNNLV